MDWEKELEKCKKDQVYFFENYFLINGQKPTKQQVENMDYYLKLAKDLRYKMLVKARNPNNSIMRYLTFIREHPLTPEEAFPQKNLKDGDT